VQQPYQHRVVSHLMMRLMHVHAACNHIKGGSLGRPGRPLAGIRLMLEADAISSNLLDQRIPHTSSTG
jgi:hypothetical protein